MLQAALFVSHCVRWTNSKQCLPKLRVHWVVRLHRGFTQQQVAMRLSEAGVSAMAVGACCLGGWHAICMDPEACGQATRLICVGTLPAV